MFEQTLLPRHPTKAGATFLASFGLQTAMVALVLLIPLFFVAPPQALPPHLLLTTPTPPPPAPLVQRLVDAPTRFVQRFIDGTKLYEPTRIPPAVADLPEPEPGIAAAGVVGSVGVPGGTGSVIDTIATAAHSITPPPPSQPAVVKAEPPKPKEVPRIRVGTGVQQARLIHRVVPVYPPLAKAARIQGTVKLMSVINRQGRIDKLEIISGHPLLVNAAVDAVRQWVYRPTYLNNEPVEVISPIDVHFIMQ